MGFCPVGICPVGLCLSELLYQWALSVPLKEGIGPKDLLEDTPTHSVNNVFTVLSLDLD